MGPAGPGGVNHRIAHAARVTARPQPKRSALVEAAQMTRTREVPELAERLRFDLANALSSHAEPCPDLLERMIGPLADPEPQPQHLLLARCQRRQHAARLIAQVDR